MEAGVFEGITGVTGSLMFVDNNHNDGLGEEFSRNKIIC